MALGVGGTFLRSVVLDVVEQLVSRDRLKQPPKGAWVFQAELTLIRPPKIRSQD